MYIFIPFTKNQPDAEYSKCIRVYGNKNRTNYTLLSWSKSKWWYGYHIEIIIFNYEFIIKICLRNPY